MALIQYKGLQTFKLETVSQELIKSNIGDHIGITVNSNPSTGYMWSVKAPECLIKVASIQADQAPGVPHGPVRIGGGYEETLVFKMGSRCEKDTTLQLIYSRPWEQTGGNVYTVFVETGDRI